MAPLLARVATRLFAWAGDDVDVMLPRPSFAECIVLVGGAF